MRRNKVFNITTKLMQSSFFWQRRMYNANLFSSSEYQDVVRQLSEMKLLLTKQDQPAFIEMIRHKERWIQEKIIQSGVAPSKALKEMHELIRMRDLHLPEDVLDLSIEFRKLILLDNLSAHYRVLQPPLSYNVFYYMGEEIIMRAFLLLESLISKLEAVQSQSDMKLVFENYQKNYNTVMKPQSEKTTDKKMPAFDCFLADFSCLFKCLADNPYPEFGKYLWYHGIKSYSEPSSPYGSGHGLLYYLEQAELKKIPITIKQAESIKKNSRAMKHKHALSDYAGKLFEIEKLTKEFKTIQEEIADNSKEYAELVTQRDKVKAQLDRLKATDTPTEDSLDSNKYQP